MLSWTAGTWRTRVEGIGVTQVLAAELSLGRVLKLVCPSGTYANLARRVFQTLALLRCHGEKGNGILLNVLTSALRATDLAFVVFTEGEN